MRVWCKVLHHPREVKGRVTPEVVSSHCEEGQYGNTGRIDDEEYECHEYDECSKNVLHFPLIIPSPMRPQ